MQSRKSSSRIKCPFNCDSEIQDFNIHINADFRNLVRIEIQRKFNNELRNFKEKIELLEKIQNNPDIIEDIEEKFNITFDKYLPILIKSENKFHNIELNIMKKTFGNKVANIIEERFDTVNSEIKNRLFISEEIISFIIN